MSVDTFSDPYSSGVLIMNVTILIQKSIRNARNLFSVYKSNACTVKWHGCGFIPGRMYHERILQVFNAGEKSH